MTNLTREVEAPASVSLDFTADWFSRHIPVWEQFRAVLPGRKTFLELGSFEGRSACWLLENLLDDDGQLYCVDTWQGSPEFAHFPEGIVEKSYERFMRNIAISKKQWQRTLIFRNTTVIALASLLAKPQFHAESFDFIYIDAGHMAYQTLTDAVMSWPLLKPGGVMVFDDYMWQLCDPIDRRPKCGVDAFTSLFNSQIQTLAIGDQYVVRKR